MKLEVTETTHHDTGFPDLRYKLRKVKIGEEKYIFKKNKPIYKTVTDYYLFLDKSTHINLSNGHRTYSENCINNYKKVSEPIDFDLEKLPDIFLREIDDHNYVYIRPKNTDYSFILISPYFETAMVYDPQRGYEKILKGKITF